MANKENLREMGMVVINAAFVLQLSWIPVIFFLEGADWITAVTAARIHRFALAYMVAGLTYGLERVVPHVSLPAVGGMMFAGVLAG